jgi:hypothetical protein
MIEIHHIKKHERTCYLNPNNLESIATYLQHGLKNAKVLNRASFYRWAKQHKIMTSVWITNRMGLEKWVQAAYQLLIYAYLKKSISFEKVDLLLDILTDGTMWLDQDIYRHLSKEARAHELESSEDADSSLHSNFMSLLASIVIRAKRDIWYHDDDLDDEEEGVDHVQDAVLFLSSFAPEVLNYCIRRNEISVEALTHVAALESDTSYSTSPP